LKWASYLKFVPKSGEIEMIINKNRSGKIHVLCVARWLVGGIRTYLKFMYGNFNPDKYSFTILTAPTDEIEVLRSDLSAFEIDIIECSLKYTSFSMVKNLVLCLLNSQVSLLHTHGFTAGIITSIVNLIFGKPHIMTSHSILGYEGEEDFSGTFGPVKKIVMTMMLKRIDIVNMVSEDAKDNLLEYLPGLASIKKRIVVIKNGIDIKKFTRRNNCPELKTQLGVDQSTVLLSFMGRFMPRKGFQDLIELIKGLRSVGIKENEIQILTVGSGRFFGKFTSSINDYQINKYFKHMDFQPNIYGILKGIDLLVVPSYWEACPLLPAESLIAGTPVIAYNCIGLREVLKDTPAIMVETGNIEQMANSVINYCKNLINYKQAFKSFIPIAKNRFDAIKSSEKLELLFQQILK